MSTKPTGAVFRNAPPKISPAALRPIPQAELARIVREAQRMRAEHIAGLLRSAGRGLTRLGRALTAQPAAARRPADPRGAGPA